MIRINNQWHYEPRNGDISWMLLVKALFRETGEKHNLKGLTDDQRADIWIYWFGDSPVPVPWSTMISVRDENGRLI